MGVLPVQVPVAEVRLPKLVMKKFFLSLLALVSFPGLSQTLYDRQLRVLYKETVPMIYPRDLQTIYKEKKKVYILDTRSAREFEVSHLPGARLINYETFNLSQVKDIPKNAPIMVYCSVGVRSERIGEKLIAAGYGQVYNLYGGIFQWKNDKQPILNAKNKVTDSVHTYNKMWSVWLRQGIKVYE